MFMVFCGLNWVQSCSFPLSLLCSPSNLTSLESLFPPSEQSKFSANSEAVRRQFWLLRQLLIFAERPPKAGAVLEPFNLASSCRVRQHEEAETFKEQVCSMCACKVVHLIIQK